MGTTGTYGFHYPEASDSPDGAGQIRQLAQDVDSALSDTDTAVQAIPAAAAGVVSITPTTPTSNAALGNYFRGTATITFPTGRFATTPAICVSANTGAPGAVIEASYSGASATGFTLTVARVDTTGLQLSWVAIEV